MEILYFSKTTFRRALWNEANRYAYPLEYNEIYGDLRENLSRWLIDMSHITLF